MKTVNPVKQNLSFRTEAKKLCLCLCPALVGAILIALSRIDPAVTEAVYSRRIFPVVSTLIGIFARFLPFSLIAVLCYALAALSVLAVIFFFITLFRTKTRGRFLLQSLRAVVLLLSVIFFLFAITCGPNYNRLTFAQQSGLSVRDSSAEELAALCEELLEKTAAARQSAHEDENGIFTLEGSFSQNAAQSLSAFRALREDFPFLLNVSIAPKAMIGSELLSYCEVTGFYSCYTSEPNVNTHMPQLELPFTMCHELAHTSGFMREDEANFIGYLACSRSDNADFRYSGLICALNYSMGQLYRVDRDAYWALRNMYSDAMNRDLAVQSAYWSYYAEKKSVAVYSAVNDAFLKANRQTDGRQSYGRMVDLLLAEYRDAHGIS